MAPFKSASGKKTLAGRASELGLVPHAENILDGKSLNTDLKVKDEKGV